MPTKVGRELIAARAGDCPTKEALTRVWQSLGDEYKRDPKTREIFREMAKGLE